MNKSGSRTCGPYLGWSVYEQLLGGVNTPLGAYQRRQSLGVVLLFVLFLTLFSLCGSAVLCFQGVGWGGGSLN